ncbi:Plasmodium exported protein (PHISTa), unknown function [Plasmodium reichenowi]|uniref:Uncharacterized protein n=1 Tax=Plasmodium reichenowi TaxID=5854 RepID=A0A2P9D6F8_PLARE|nr:Plasmodium exported protein (PHISTa), unknown function [Plasmodium reichenowi]
MKKLPPKNELINLRHQSFNYGCKNYIGKKLLDIELKYTNKFNSLLNQEHKLDNIKNHKFFCIVTFEEMKEKLYNIYKTKFQHIVQNPKKYYKKDFY